jgi:hypothetical protein
MLRTKHRPIEIFVLHFILSELITRLRERHAHQSAQQHRLQKKPCRVFHVPPFPCEGFESCEKKFAQTVRNGCANADCPAVVA